MTKWIRTNIPKTTLISGTLYKFNVFSNKKFSFGTWTSRQHIFLALRTDTRTGWGENIISINSPKTSPEAWLSCVHDIMGLDLYDALDYVRSKIGIWEDRISEIIECALIDLIAQTEQVSALEYLGLTGKDPVHGVHVILSDNVRFVASETQWAVDSDKANFIKVKLFGDFVLDQAIIQSVRSVASRERTFLIGDVNGGYVLKDCDGSLIKLSDQLKLHYEAGLDACEDPASMSNNDWVRLQKLVSPLSLIPDYPMRPAAKAQQTLLANMGRIYNIHPGTSGSILDTISLARHVLQEGAKLMIGDDSLIGPGCTIWQQLAIGLGAAWVEATEKRGESDGFELALLDRATDPTTSHIRLKPSLGFGLSINEDILKEQASEWITTSVCK